MEISEGVKVELLFTPRISMYQEMIAPLPDLDKDAGVVKVMERYADIMYFAALNAWELDGHGTIDNFPCMRGDFHGWMTADPKGFAQGVKFAVTALTGKTEKQLKEDEERARNSGGNVSPSGGGMEVKKKRCWLSRIMHLSKHSS